jgi:hypothetical protein
MGQCQCVLQKILQLTALRKSPEEFEHLCFAVESVSHECRLAPGCMISERRCLRICAAHQNLQRKVDQTNKKTAGSRLSFWKYGGARPHMVSVSVPQKTCSERFCATPEEFC